MLSSNAYLAAPSTCLFTKAVHRFSRGLLVKITQHHHIIISTGTLFSFETNGNVLMGFNILAFIYYIVDIFIFANCHES